MNIETARRNAEMLISTDIHEAAALFGRRDEKIRLIEKEFGVVVMSRGHDVHIDGDSGDVEIAERVVRDLLEVIREGHRLTIGDVRYGIELAKEGSRTSLAMIMGTDLPSLKLSGLNEVRYILSDVEGIESVCLTDKDVVRHEIMRRIIRAYEKYDNEKSLSGEKVEV